jgi:hypothetical protein
MSNRRWIGVLVLVLLIVAAGIGIGVGAYHAGFVHGAVQGGARVVYAAPYAHAYGWGFFPFGFFLFPLFLIALFVGLRLAFGGPRRWDGGGRGGLGPAGPGAWGPGGPRERLDAWHREAHAGPGAAATGTGEMGAASSTA